MKNERTVAVDGRTVHAKWFLTNTMTMLVREHEI